MRTFTVKSLVVALSAATLAFNALAEDDDDSIPSVIISVENSAPSRGALQTPFWVGIHNGEFNIYNRNAALGAPGTVPSPAVERLAEDGATGPITDAFSVSQPTSPQATITGPSGPLQPGDFGSVTLNVDPLVDRYFSYASMVIPSNDAFVANGNPFAHVMFDEDGNFVAEDFAVAGTEVLDAGTEVNNEVAADTAFLNQGGPDIGITENGVVVIHPGLLAPGTVSYPDGVLNHPVFGLADFFAPNYRVATFKFDYIDLGARNVFRASLGADQEVTGPLVESDGFGRGRVLSSGLERLNVRIRFNDLTGPVTMAHLHLGRPGMNGPVVVNLADGLSPRNVRLNIDGSNVVGPLASDDPEQAMLNLQNAMAAGNIYINLHTEVNPGGELRGQLHFDPRGLGDD